MEGEAAGKDASDVIYKKQKKPPVTLLTCLRKAFQTLSFHGWKGPGANDFEWMANKLTHHVDACSTYYPSKTWNKEALDEWWKNEMRQMVINAEIR